MLIINILILIVSVIILYLLLFNKNDISKDTSTIDNGIANLDKNINKIDQVLRDETARNREELNTNLQSSRVELNNSFKTLAESISLRMNELANIQKNQFDTFVEQEQKQMQSFEVKLDKMNDIIDRRLKDFQAQNNSDLKSNRDELSTAFKSFENKFTDNITEFSKLQKQEFELLTNSQKELLKSTETKLENLRQVVENKLKLIQDDNNDKLERMRITVDEKLHKTLEQRLGESFKLVSERLESVQRGLGEMKVLADGVGNLKKVLSNVKNRGVLGEYQLANILEQLLSVEQYAKNKQLKDGSSSSVEYAVKLPGQADGQIVWLPIDSKFPLDTYEQLTDAFEKADIPIIEQAKKNLEAAVKMAAKDICKKYIMPPNTTDFAIMFFPFEGLYAEVLRIPGLFDQIQREYKVIITGPTTLSAILNSLQMGFRTLVIQKRSSEIWRVLGAIKTEFSKFGVVLKKAQEKIHKAGEEIDDLVGTRTRQIERKLRDIQELPENEVLKLLPSENIENDVEENTSEEEEIPF